MGKIKHLVDVIIRHPNWYNIECHFLVMRHYNSPKFKARIQKRVKRRPSVDHNVRQLKLYYVGIIVFSTALLFLCVILFISSDQKQLSSDKPFNNSYLADDIPLVEIPATAAKFAGACKEKSAQQRLIVACFSNEHKVQPMLLPFLVSSLVRACPDQIDIILQNAMRREPDLILAYAQAAILQCPERGEIIAYTLTSLAPWHAAAIVQTLDEATYAVSTIEKAALKAISITSKERSEAGVK